MQGPAPDQPFSGDADAITLGALRLDRAGFSVTIHGRHLALTLAEFLLLQQLVLHPHQVLGRDRLAGALREFTSTSEPPPSSRSVDTHISRLRAKLRAAGYDCIKTMRFVGYRFVPVEA